MISKLLILGSAAFVVVVIALFSTGYGIRWVGFTDLEVRFVVTDAATDKPIPNAMIQIVVGPGGFCDVPPETGIALITDELGSASHVATNCMCSGYEGILKDKFASHLPHWSYRVTSIGYSPTTGANLEEIKNARVQRGKPFATLTVPVKLHHSPIVLTNGQTFN